MSYFDIIVTIIYFIIFPFYLLTKYSKVVLLLYAFHTMFVLAYWNSTNGNCSADACLYWFMTRITIDPSRTWFTYFGLSTNFLLFLNYPLVKFLRLDFLYGFLLYGMVGFLGILNLYKMLSHYDYGKVKIQGIYVWVILLFFPNMHYWTSAIGKDTLAFFSISYIFLHVIKNKTINFKVVFVSAFFFLTRPHIAVFLLSSIGAATILNNKNLALSKRIFLGVLGVIVIPILVSITLSYWQLDLDVDDINQNFDAAAFHLSAKAGSAIPMNDYILPMKVFTILFRPFLFDIHDGATLVLATENTIAFLLFVWAIKLRLKWKIKLPYQIQAVIFFSAISTIFFSYRDTNLGIIIRMKNMVFPFLLTYLIYIISYSSLVPYLIARQRQEQLLKS